MTTHTPPKNTRRAILDAADACVNGQRATDYGTPEDNFARIARLWNTHLANIGTRNLKTIGDELVDADEYLTRGFTPTDVALMLAMVKMARLANDPSHKDSWIDIAGYAACGAECVGVKP